MTATATTAVPFTDFRAHVRSFEAAGVDQIILLQQAGRNRHEHICSSLELFAKEVMPEFHAHEPAHQAWKKSVLAGEIELPDVEADPEKEKLETAQARGRA